MSNMSKRFKSSGWMEMLIPALLIFLVLALLTVMVISGMSLVGGLPGT